MCCESLPIFNIACVNKGQFTEKNTTKLLKIIKIIKNKYLNLKIVQKSKV